MAQYLLSALNPTPGIGQFAIQSLLPIGIHKQLANQYC